MTTAALAEKLGLIKFPESLKTEFKIKELGGSCCNMEAKLG